HQAGIGRARVLHGPPRGQRRKDVQLPQVPHHGPRRRRDAARPAGEERSRRSSIQAGKGSPRHSSRPVDTSGQPRRTAPARERRPRRDEPRRAAALTVPGEPDVRAVARRPFVGAAGNYRPMAGVPQQSLERRFSSVDPLRPSVRETPLRASRPEDNPRDDIHAWRQMERAPDMDHPRRGPSTAVSVIERAPSQTTVGPSIHTLRRLALNGLGPMYDRAARRFVFCVRRSGRSTVGEGLSTRYTAITAIGLAREDSDVVRDILGGEHLGDLLRRLIDDADTMTNLGDLALLAWAGRLWDCSTDRVWSRIQTFQPDTHTHPTVEVAWTLSASVVDPVAPGALGERLADRLRRAFAPDAGLFPHQVGARGSMRAHISCFADFVYPTLALAQFGRAAHDRASIVCAARAAETMCRLQGTDGQWWWHFDYRTGRIVEPYPV